MTHLPSADPAEQTDPATIRLLLVVSVALITFAAFEALAVVTAMPTVSRALDGDQLYALAFGVTLATQVATTPAAGRWCDAGGTRAALTTGVLTFIAGLTVAGVAPSMWILVVGRAVQGVGGALVIVPLYVLVGTVVPAARRPGFFAWFSAAWVVPSLVGPLLAGFLAEHVSWRWVFLGVAGVAVPALFLVFAVLSRIGRQQAAAGAAREERRRRATELAGANDAVVDVRTAEAPASGATAEPTDAGTSPSTVPAGDRTGAPGDGEGPARHGVPARSPADDGAGPTTAVSRQVDAGRAAARSTRSVTYVAIGAGLGAALLQSAGSAPGERVGLTLSDWLGIGVGLMVLAACLPRLLPAGALRLRPRVPALVAGRGLLNGSFIGVEIYLVLLLQEQHGWDAMQSGMVLTVGSLSWGLGSVISARVSDATRARLPWIGAALLACGIAIVLPTSWPGVPAWITIVGWFVAGGGIGLTMSASSVLALGWTARDRQGEVSAHLQIADALGAAVLVALIGVAVAVMPLGAVGQLPYVAALAIALVLSVLSSVAGHRSQGGARRR